MINIVFGFAVFLLSIVTGAAAVMFGPDADFTALQGSLVLFASLLGMLCGVVIINGGKL
jgi:hypothetical protein